MGRRGIRLGIVATGALLVACGGKAKKSPAGSDGTVGSGGTVGSDGTVGSGGTGGANGTTRGSRTSSAGSGGIEAQGVGGTGGTGGASACGRPPYRVDACVDYLEGSAGEGGLGGRGPFPEFDECPDDSAFGDCEQRLSGTVTAVGTTEGWCDDPRFLWTTPDDTRGDHRVILLSNTDTPVGYDAGVAFGPMQNELDVEVGDELEIILQSGWYHAGFMFGSRITVMRGDELIAVVNSEYPVDDLISIGELDFARGALLCREPEDDLSCTYSEHWFDASLNAETESIAPGAEAVLEPFEIVVDENYAVADGGACDAGDTTRFGAFRFKVGD